MVAMRSVITPALAWGGMDEEGFLELLVAAATGAKPYSAPDFWVLSPLSWGSFMRSHQIRRDDGDITDHRRPDIRELRRCLCSV
jgi:hypothetical protein